MAHLLTPHGVRTLIQPKASSVKPPPVTVQVLTIKQVTSGPQERFRVVLSDGEHYVQGMFSTQLNHLAQRLQPNGLLQVEDFMSNSVQGKTICILLSASVLPDPQPTERIGAAVEIDPAACASSATAVTPLYNSTNNSNGTMNNQAYQKPNNAYSNNNSYSNNNNNNNGGSPSNPYGRSPTASSAPIVRSDAATSQFTMIKDLNLYQSRWTLQARVTHKSDVRTWSNAKGEGSLFSVDLLDQSGVDIRATFFKEAVDRFHPMLEVGQVYTFAGGRLKVANARWNTCKSPNEITFDQNSEIHLSTQGNSAIQSQAYEFVENIAALEQMGENSLPGQQQQQQGGGQPVNVDVLAFVQNVGEPATIISKKQGKELTKCDVTLVDDSGAEINLTLWGDQAQTARTTLPLHELVAVRRARLSDFNGKSLSGAQSVALASKDPILQQLPAFGRLQQWYQQTGGQGARNLSGSGGGGKGGYTPLAQRKHIGNITAENLGYSEKGDYLTFVATITFFKKDKEGGAWYPACPNSEEPCRNRCKVTPSATGAMGGAESWSCERCQGTYNNCVRKWIFSGVIEDETGSTWVTFFDESGILLFDGKTADEIHKQTEGMGSGDAYDSAFSKASFSEWIFKCKVKQEYHNDEPRRKTTVASMTPVNYVQESKDMLTAIAQF